MKRILICLVLLFLSFQGFSGKPRIVISSDFPPVDVIPGTLDYGSPEQKSDPDDIQSMVRFLVYANEFEILGLIAAAGTLANVANKQHMLDMIAVYGKVEKNLRRHDPGYPKAEALRKVTKNGLSGTYARPWQEILGEGKDSEASDYLATLLQEPGSDPIWFCFWGGTQELAQALWRLKQDVKDTDRLNQIVSKIRVFMIAKQDGTGQWLIDHFPDLFTIVMQNAYKGFFYYAPGADEQIGNLDWLDQHIRTNHGPLGKVYPESGWDHTKKGVVEGDTPSFLYVLSGAMGLSDPEKPWYGGWGGRFKPDSANQKLWLDAEEGGKSLTLWQYARQNHFAARMERCVKKPGKTNRNPVAVLNHNTSRDILYMEAQVHQEVKLSADGSKDPDGNALSHTWWQYAESGTYPGSISFKEKNNADVSFTVPPDAAGEVMHIILEVKDNGQPSLSSYRRIVVTVKE